MGLTTETATLDRLLGIVSLPDFYNVVREALIWGDEAVTDFDGLRAEVGYSALGPTIALKAAVEIIRDLHREALTETLLQFSLCPIHRHDYAICFDDQNPECAAVRTIHPNHDS